MDVYRGNAFKLYWKLGKKCSSLCNYRRETDLSARGCAVTVYFGCYNVKMHQAEINPILSTALAAFITGTFSILDCDRVWTKMVNVRTRLFWM